MNNSDKGVEFTFNKSKTTEVEKNEINAKEIAEVENAVKESTDTTVEEDLNLPYIVHLR